MPSPVINWDDFEAVKAPAPAVDWSDFEAAGPPRLRTSQLGAPPLPDDAEEAAMGDEGHPFRAATATMGGVFKLLGGVAKDVAGAYAFEAIGEPSLQAQQLGLDPATIKQLGGEDLAPSADPIEEGRQLLPTAGKVLSGASYGLVEATPKLAATAAAAPYVGPALAAGAVFGTTPTGFDPEDAAVAAVLPGVGRYSGKLIGAIAKQFGVSTKNALNIWRAAGAMGGAATYLGVIDESKIENLPPEQREQARIDMVAGLMGQSVLGPMGLEKENPAKAIDVEVENVTGAKPGAAAPEPEIVPPTTPTTPTTRTEPAVPPPEEPIASDAPVTPEAQPNTIDLLPADATPEELQAHVDELQAEENKPANDANDAGVAGLQTLHDEATPEDLPNDLPTLQRLKGEVETRLDEVEEASRAKQAGTEFEGQSAWSDVKPTMDVLTALNSKIAEVETGNPVDKGPAEAEIAADEQHPDQPGAPASGMVVREPPGPRAGTAPIEAAEAVAGTEGAGSPEGGAGVPAGGLQPGGSAGDERPDTIPAGRPGDNAGPGPGVPAPRGATGDSAQSDLNHVLPPDADWIPSGDKAKANANLAAIRLLKQLEAEDRNPTPEEKQVLARYTGWGGLKQVFDEGKASYRERQHFYNPEQEKEFRNWEKSWGPLYDAVKAEMSPEEWNRAARSVLNAHYTSREVINAIWAAAKHLGFKGGKVLEAGAGAGNFIGLTPEDVRNKTRWTAVEKDDLSGRLLAKLYPQAQVHQTGFEKASIAANSQDLMIGNVPFAAEGPIDKRYPAFSLHNYFIARGLDLLKPGGLMAVVTSDSTLDSPASRKAREYLAERADLVGAMRLPNNAFSKNAGTEVTTDVLFFRKHDATPFQGHPFTETRPTETYKHDPAEINQYYTEHPGMMLGKLSKEGTMYGRGEQQALLPHAGRELPQQMAEAIAQLPANVMGSRVTPEELASGTPQKAEAGAKVGGLVTSGDTVKQVEPDGTLTAPDWADDKKKVAQAKRYVAVRDTAKQYISRMLDPGVTDEQLAKDREQLNKTYDAYVAKHGALNARNGRYLDDDVDYPLAMALEDERIETVKENGRERRVPVYSKSRMFKERTIFPRQAPDRAETVKDALDVSLNYTGKVDPEYMARLTGKTPEQVQTALREDGQAFENPATGLWESRANYLSGFVKDKLQRAQHAVADNPTYATNIRELEKVQPQRIPIDQISVKLGATWVPTHAIEQFLRDVLEVTANVHFTPETGHWTVSPRAGQQAARNLTKYGIHGWKGHEIVEAALNLKQPVVTRTEPYVGADGRNATREVRDPGATAEASAKQDQLQREWQQWAKTNPAVSGELENIYNEKFNGVVAPKYDAPSWTHYPGASTDVTLREHQKEVATRMIQNSTLLAHAVGTGKTYAMITAAQEMKRLGLARKPMIVVQNATLEQFARSYKKLYPTAKILVPGSKDRDAARRNKTMSRIATGDWDAVIIPQSFVNLLPDDAKRESDYIQKQLDELKAAKIEAAHGAGKKSPKTADLQRAIERLEKRLTDLADRKTDNVLTFEQLGVDALFVDEAHAYKKLEFTTQMDNIKGLDKGASQRAFSMFMKTRWVQEHNQGRNVTFATGTPVSNTLAEAWNMMRFVRPDVLKKFHMENFDDFASIFGDRVTTMEMTAGGTWKPVTRFAKFTNGPELISAWRTVADVVTPDQLNLPGLPRLKNGKPTAVIVKQSPRLKSYVEHLRNMLEAFDKMSGKEKRENSHIPLVVFGLAKKASLDMRMIDPSLSDEEGSKLNRAADEVTRIYRASTPVKGAQMVFADIYQDNPDDPKFNVYEEMRKKLIARGIPAEEIAIVTPELKDTRREALFKKVNDGDIRVIMGSSERMGVGVNAQEHLIGLHHLDAPHRPMDIEQRTGRMLRQGNSNPEVEEMRYGVENTLDAALFQKLATKQKFINQILRGDVSGRDFEDAANEQSLSFEEQMAAFSGDKRTVEKFALENQVRQLEGLRSGHFQQVRQANSRIADIQKRDLPGAEKTLAAEQQRAAEMAAAFPPEREPSLEMAGQKTDGRKAVVPKLELLIKNLMAEAEGNVAKRVNMEEKPSSKPVPLVLNGRPLVLQASIPLDFTTGAARVADAAVRWHFAESPGGYQEVTTGAGLLQSVQAAAQNIQRAPQFTEGRVANYQKDLKELSGFVQQPFEQETALTAAKERLAGINAELAAEGAKKPDEPLTPPEPGPGQNPGMGFATHVEFSQPTIESQITGKLAPPRPQRPPGQSPTTGPTLTAWQQVVQGGKEWAKGTWAGLALHSAPRTTAKARHLGELLVRWAAAKGAARPMAEVFAADVLSNSGISPLDLGAALTEDNLRSVKAAFTEAGDTEAADKVQSFVGKPNFPFRTEEAYQAFLADPAVKEVLARHRDLWEAVVEPQYRAAMDIDPDVELESRGLQTDARINLRAVVEGEGGRDVVRGTPRGNLMGTLRKKSPFGVQARGTADAYHINYYDIMANTFGRQSEIAAKNDFEKELVAAGQALIAAPGQHVMIEGQRAVAFPLKQQRAVIVKPGEQTKVRSQNKSIYINAKLAPEYRTVANVDAPTKAGAVVKAVNGVLNRAALSGLTDVTTHVANQLSTLFTLPGTTGRPLLQDAALSVLPGRPDFAVAVGRAIVRGFQDNRAQLAALAQIGALREPHEPTSVPFLRQTSQLVEWMDKAVRLALDDAYQSLVQQGIEDYSETGRREFINQVGQYNRKLQGPLRRIFRDTGLGPFVTAGTTFNTLGVRGVFLNAGVKGASPAARWALRANMLAKLLGTAATVALLNYLFTKDKGGGVMGRPGVRIGDIDTGMTDKNGKPLAIPLFSMIGPGRGLRVTGVRGVLESRERGLPWGTAVDAGARDALNAAISPFAGPAVRFAVTAASGYPPAVGVGRSTKVVAPGESQFAQNIKEGILQANPVTTGIAKANEPGGDVMDAVRSQLPRLLPQPAKPMDMMRDYPAIVRRAQANAFIEDVIGRARKMNPAERLPFLEQSLMRLEDPGDRKRAKRELKIRKVL